MYDYSSNGLQILLAHPGGPYYVNRDDGFWGFPKGVIDPNENLLDAAKREFEEETGLTPVAPFIPLGENKFKNGKIIHLWAFKNNLPTAYQLTSNTFTVEWPPKSGRQQTYPEIDRIEMFSLKNAKVKCHPIQSVFIDRLLQII